MVIKNAFAFLFLRHDRTNEQIVNGADDLRQNLAILPVDSLGLVSENINEIDVLSFLQYFNNT